MSEWEPKSQYVRYPRTTDDLRKQDVANAFGMNAALPVMTVFIVGTLHAYLKLGDPICLGAVFVGSFAIFFATNRLLFKVVELNGWNAAVSWLAGIALSLNPILWELLFKGRYPISVLAPTAVVCSGIFAIGKLAGRTFDRVDSRRAYDGPSCLPPEI